MKQLWAPWRMSYIQGDDSSAEQDCIFCVRELPGDEELLILKRSRHCFVIMNKYPYSNGHLMVAPYRHTADLADLQADEVLDMHNMTVMARDVLKSCCAAQGFNVGMNWGHIAGAGVAEHLHLHLVPRWSGDTNFMPVFADVRVIPQHLDETYQLLKQGFQTLKK
jgi:ATP adenylyltransferase